MPQRPAPRLPPLPPRRRSHAERSASTRAQLLGAAADLVHGGGMQAASMFEVAKAAGVTPGALQHHFGSKAELMMQVIEHILLIISQKQVRRGRIEFLSRCAVAVFDGISQETKFI